MIGLRTFSVFVVSSLCLVLGCMETRDILATTESHGCGIPLALRSPKKLHIVTVRGENIFGHYRSATLTSVTISTRVGPHEDRKREFPCSELASVTYSRVSAVRTGALVLMLGVATTGVVLWQVAASVGV